MDRTRPGAWIGLAASVLLVALSQFQIQKQFQWRNAPLTNLVVTDHYAQDLGALLLGTRRLAADLAYVQFLQYYGEERGPDGRPLHEEPHSGHHHHGLDYGDGNYPLVLEFGQRILRLDPFFNSPILEIAGALAFNLKNSNESLALLAEAVKLDPTFHRYRLYIAAILYKNESKDDRLIDLLEQDVKYRDCPALLKLVLGNLLKKRGRLTQAVDVYLNVIETAPNDYDKETARRRIEEIIADHPNLRFYSGLSK